MGTLSRISALSLLALQLVGCLIETQSSDKSQSSVVGAVPGCNSSGQSDEQNPHCRSSSTTISPLALGLPYGYGPGFTVDSQDNVYTFPGYFVQPFGGIVKTTPSGQTTTFLAGQAAGFLAKDTADNIYVENLTYGLGGGIAHSEIDIISLAGTISMFCSSLVTSNCDLYSFIGVVDSKGNLLTPYAFETGIERIGPGGTLGYLIGGNGRGCTDGPSSLATLNSIVAMAIDGNDNIYVLDWGLGSWSSGYPTQGPCNSIRKIAPDGSVTTLRSFSNNEYVSTLTVDSAGNLYFDYDVSNVGYPHIVKMTPTGDSATFCFQDSAGDQVQPGIMPTGYGNCSSGWNNQGGVIGLDALGNFIAYAVDTDSAYPVDTFVILKIAPVRSSSDNTH
jgi:hypothetical protein